jgi:hypothetical protein
MDKEDDFARDRARQEKFQSLQPRKEGVRKDEELRWTDEEYAAELSVHSLPKKGVQSNPFSEVGGSREVKLEETPEPAAVTAGSRTVGYAGLLISLLSLFVWPVILGPAAVVLGIMAYRGGSRGLGTWSIGIGLLSFAAYFLLIPYYS